jgi:TATA-box binding protein (TBP) (component of TFIID and TFIIIB)
MQRETEEYVKEMFRICEEATITPKPTYLSMTTITSTFKIDSLIDVHDLKQKMKDVPFVIKKKGSTKTFEWSIKENKFFNQVTAEYRDDFSKKSIKFFPNGSIHVTGCSDLIDCHRVMNQVVLCIKHYTDKEVETTDFKILMINANFSVNSVLNLNAVTKKSEDAGCQVSFKPEIYSAVKIKFVPGPDMKRITASVFSSGCILITGARTLREITASYEFLLNMIGSTCVRPNVNESKKFKSYIGTPFSVWKKHLLANK